MTPKLMLVLVSRIPGTFWVLLGTFPGKKGQKYLRYFWAALEQTARTHAQAARVRTYVARIVWRIAGFAPSLPSWIMDGWIRMHSLEREAACQVTSHHITSPRYHGL